MDTILKELQITNCTKQTFFNKFTAA